MFAINAISRNAMKVLPRTATVPHRTMAKESRAHLYTGMPTNLTELRNSIWLSDPGAYPVIVVLTFACGFAGSFISYCCLCNPDVRITPGRRQQLIRNWE